MDWPKEGGKVWYFCSIFLNADHRGEIRLSLKSLRNFWSNELLKIRKNDGQTHTYFFIEFYSKEFRKIRFSKEDYKNSWWYSDTI